MKLKQESKRQKCEPTTPETPCSRRGYHDDAELIDPKGGGFVRCRDCGRELDMEDPDGDLAIW